MIAEKCNKCQLKLDGLCNGIQAEAADSEERPCEDFTDFAEWQGDKETEAQRQGAENLW